MIDAVIARLIAISQPAASMRASRMRAHSGANIAGSACMVQLANSTPIAVPPAPINRPSATRARTSSTRLAPSARRTATSRAREAARERSSVATFAQQISSTRAVAPTPRPPATGSAIGRSDRAARLARPSSLYGASGSIARPRFVAGNLSAQTRTRSGDVTPGVVDWGRASAARRWPAAIAALRDDFRRGGKRQPHIHRPAKFETTEAARRDTDDPIAPAIDQDATPKNVVGAIEPARPEFFADDRKPFAPAAAISAAVISRPTSGVAPSASK